ncbi:MAG: ATP-binding protein [Chitinophagaceae bacterium]|nr:ATP-binding protein [Chitinophagaceae bacterium]
MPNSTPEEHHKYEMKMSLEVLKHLGLNLYSNIPAVLAEAVSNSYDADADKITIQIEEGKITISDDGNGMTLNEINNKFLLVGYKKREDIGGGLSFKYHRPVMGRKGIGKLSLFSIANNIEIHTIKDGEKNGLTLNRFEIEKQIADDKKYYPMDVPADAFNIEKGTTIILTNFKRSTAYSEMYLRRRLAKRFSVIGDSFQVIVNVTPIGVADRDFFKKVQFLWLIGLADITSVAKHSYTSVAKLPGDFLVIEKENGKQISTPVSISGWIGAVQVPADLEEESANNNKISILSRGKLWLEDILRTYNESGIYATYLIGEIHADFLDLDEKDDIATSSRQSIKEDDPRFLALSAHVFTLLKQIKSVWVAMRNEAAKTTALAKAESFNPALREWFDSLKTDKSREYAISLFATIDSFHFDKADENKHKAVLYAQGILAFEKLRLKENLNELALIKTPDDLRLSSIFNSMDDIEASMYYDIAAERVAIIRQFRDLLDINEKERVIQKYLFNHLWLLNPSWERATEGTESMEQRVETEFKKVVDSLSKEEREARFDIKYRSAAGKHIIIELKRFHPTYKITVFKLAEQVSKYKTALEKCLLAIGTKNPHIETVIVLGDILTDDPKTVTGVLREVDSRVIYYDELIDQSLQAYSQYLEKQKDAGRIKAITEKILNNSKN